jgi:chorismate mutase/prephenate dehydratase
MTRVAYLGPEATFTHLAARRQFGADAETLPMGTIVAVFAAVEKGDCDYGVVPVENSTEGVVSHTLDNFVDSDLEISAEIVLPISHCLLARAEVIQDRVLRVYSHPQALAQCRQWIEARLPSASQVETASTAEAARLALGDESGAAIASELAAQRYGLTILSRAIEDRSVNVTRFLVIGRHQAVPSGSDRTSLLLALRDEPGILHRVLAPFAAAGINMSRIESRPSRKRPWEYVFFVDIDGHQRDPAIARALAEVGGIARAVKVLGSYPKAAQCDAG